MTDKEQKLLDTAISNFQELGVRVGMRMVLRSIEAGATIDMVKFMCEEYLK